VFLMFFNGHEKSMGCVHLKLVLKRRRRCGVEVGRKESICIEEVRRGKLS
jgi:hypothetical protein